MRVEEEQEDGDWAENELGFVQLGDQRLTQRLVTLARSLARAPDMPLPQALPQWRDLKAAYRFFDNAKAVPEHILAGHIDATWSRTRSVPLVLAVQDTTYLNWEHHPATQGLGGLSDAGRGIICHSTLAVTPERLPLGLLAQRNRVRDDATFGKLPSHKKRAIGDKESIKWLESVEALAVARETAPHTTFVSVGDREADVYELFAMQRPAGIELLVRASWNRAVDSEHRYLRETLQAAPALGTVEVSVPLRICHALCCLPRMNGKPCIATSSVCPNRLPRRLPWRRRCCGLPGWAVSSTAKEMALLGRMCSGAAFSICPTLPTCSSSCGATNDLWVKIRLPGWRIHRSTNCAAAESGMTWPRSGS